MTSRRHRSHAGVQRTTRFPAWDVPVPVRLTRRTLRARAARAMTRERNRGKKFPFSHRTRDRVRARVADDARVQERPRPHDRVRARTDGGTTRYPTGTPDSGDRNDDDEPRGSVESTTTTTTTTGTIKNVKRRCRLVRTLVRPREAGDATRERTSSSEDGAGRQRYVRSVGRT